MSYLSCTNTKMKQSVANYEIKLIGHIYNNKESNFRFFKFNDI